MPCYSVVIISVLNILRNQMLKGIRITLITVSRILSPPTFTLWFLRVKMTGVFKFGGQKQNYTAVCFATETK